MKNELLAETAEAYNKLVKNRHYLSRLDSFMKEEVREYAMQKTMRKIEFWDRFCMVEGNAKQIIPIAEKAGFDNILTYQLSKDLEYCQAEAVIKLIDECWNKKEPDKHLPEQALLMFYHNETMKNDNSKICKLWRFYSKKVNRLGTLDTNLKNKNKVELFEKVIEKLTGEQKIRAEKDLKTLKISIEDQGFII
jgi:hypothetical protein